ncbi:MAG: hypothetical protein AAF745_15645 [Planctomycetota bacterium]
MRTLLMLSAFAVTLGLLLSPTRLIAEGVGHSGVGGLSTLFHYAHFLGFIALGLTIELLKSPDSRIERWALLIVCATTTEFAQIPLPSRSFEWVDLAQNLFGLGVGVAVALLGGLFGRLFFYAVWPDPMLHEESSLEYLDRVRRSAK